MSERKQRLLKAHRRNKRIALLLALVVLVAIGIAGAWWWVPVLLVLGWIAHEAWFADHLFYRPSDDYLYEFAAGTPVQDVAIGADGRVSLSQSLAAGETLVLEVQLRAAWLGRWVDPAVLIGDDRQEFERGVRGRRYLNLSGQADALAAGTLRINGALCRVGPKARLFVHSNEDFAKGRVMIIAPHADDAELAAFGLYSRCAEASIVTLTQGEIEAEQYLQLGLSLSEAAELKGRLRSWDSLAVPLWGGVPASRCVQLGYYCLQLKPMAAEPGEAFGSRESQQSDIRSVRQHNPLTLPGDADGQPTWNNLVADIAALLAHYRPDVVVTPHPQLDPHADHIASTQALFAAMAISAHKPRQALFYANHLHDNDRWPMGRAGAGIALPPAIEALPADRLWSPLIPKATQLNKAMALGMQHDLQGRPALKKRLRRCVQYWLAGRRWPATGEDEFFRKAVRRHELFWVRDLHD